MVKRLRSIGQLHSIFDDDFVPDGTRPEMAQQQPSIHRDVSVELIDQARPQFQACSPARESNSESKKLKCNETQVSESPVVSVLFHFIAQIVEFVFMIALAGGARSFDHSTC